MFHQCSRPTDEPTVWRCKVQQRYPILWVMVQRWMCSWFCRDILPWSSKSAEFPFQSRFHRPESAWAESLEGNRSSLLLYELHRVRNLPIQLLQCNVLSPSCFQHHSDLEWKEAVHASTHQRDSWGVAGRFNIILILKFWHVVLTENEVVGPKDLSKWSGSDGIHRTGFQIDKNCSWYIFSTWKICRVDNNKLSVMVASSNFQIEDNARNATRTREMKCFKGQQAIPVASL